MRKRIKSILIGRRNESGAVPIIFGLSILALLGFVGLVHDFVLAYVENREMQIAAEAAALGGAFTLKRDDTVNVVNNAEAELTRNGFEEGSSFVYYPPQTGDFAGDKDFVEVVLTKDLQTYFGNFFEIGSLTNHDTVTLQTRAVAGLKGSGSGCIYVLTGEREKAFRISNGSTVDATGCDVLVSSCDDKGALFVDRGAIFNANKIDVCGAYDVSGTAIDPEPNTGKGCGHPRCGPGLDPLRNIGPPSNANGSCDETDFRVTRRGSRGYRYSLSPGVYCNGLWVEKGSHVEFEPGTYILKGGGLQITGHSSVTGRGVCFYNTEGSGYAYKAILIDSGSSATLSAPLEGEMKGLLFFQDRNVHGQYDNKIASTAGISLGGTLYFPTQHLMIQANTVTQNPVNWSLIVSHTLEVSSGGTLEMGADLDGYRPGTIKEVRLVEGSLS